MATQSPTVYDTEARELAQEDLQALFDALTSRGWTVVGPTVRDGAVVLAELASADELPYGVGVALAPGGYRLRHRADRAAFAHSAGPQSWKTFLHPERARLWQADRDEEGTVSFTPDTEETAPAPRYALLGVHPCDLAAIARQDRVLIGGVFRDPVYAPRREAAFVIAVACGERHRPRRHHHRPGHRDAAPDLAAPVGRARSRRLQLPHPGRPTPAPDAAVRT